MAKRKVITTYTEPRIKLEVYSSTKSRGTCPQCRKKNVFSNYVDVTDGSYISEGKFGRCNREIECGYHLAPNGEDMKGKSFMVSSTEVLPQFLPKDYISLINSKFVNKSMMLKDDSLTRFLLTKFTYEQVNRVRRLYLIGTSQLWKNATIFWQIDQDGDTRTGKIMAYDPETGKRVKEPMSLITWAHSKYPDYALTQCFFGAHLINKTKKVAKVVESEKTAYIAAIVQPKSTFLATGGIQNINEYRMSMFKGTGLKGIFYPDKGKAYNIWLEKLKPFIEDPEYDVEVSDTLEHMDELSEGDDLADYILLKK